MILAAGFGTRLLPHTLIKPKPLFPLFNTPLLLLIISRLKAIGVDHIIINCHHLSTQLAKCLENVDNVTLIEEEMILGTGGGLRGAVNTFRDEPLLVTNCDIYHTVDIERFYDFHVKSDNMVSLAIHDYPRFNSLSIGGDCIKSFDPEQGEKKYAFTGLHLVQPEILQAIPENVYSCIVDHYRGLLAGQFCIGAYSADGCFWTDIGTPGDYLALHEGIVHGHIPCWPEIEIPANLLCIADNSQISESARMTDWVCIGGAKIGGNAHISKSIIWEDVTIPADAIIQNRIISRDDQL